MKLISILIIAFIFVLQQLEIRSLVRQVEVLSSVCDKLRSLNDKQIQASKDMLELIKTQRNALDSMITAVNEASKKSESVDIK